jgi:hypothetical protein
VESGHLPEEVLSLVRPLVGGDGEVIFFNGGEAQLTMDWRRVGAGVWERVELEPGQMAQCALKEQL